jgi:hypothetical protein
MYGCTKIHIEHRQQEDCVLHDHKEAAHTSVPYDMLGMAYGTKLSAACVFMVQHTVPCLQMLYIILLAPHFSRQPCCCQFKMLWALFSSMVQEQQQGSF